LDQLSQKQNEITADKIKQFSFENSPVPVLWTDSNGKILGFNKASVKFFNASDLTGSNLSIYTGEEGKELFRKIWEELSEIETVRFFEKIRVKNSIIPVEITACRHSDDAVLLYIMDIGKEHCSSATACPAGRNIIFGSNDLFEQKKLEDMGLMINAIAHRWRQPINALIFFVQDILDTYESGELTAEYIKSFESVCKELIIQMSKTIDDFRTFYAPDKTPVKFSLTKEIVTLMQLLREQLLDKEINYFIVCKCGEGQIDCTDGLDEAGCESRNLVISGYLDEFKQVLINIIYNSVDAIEDNRRKGAIEKGTIKIILEKDKGNAIIRIMDNGTGIPDDSFGKVFEPYFSTKKEGHGNGLGLYMTKMVMEKHNQGKVRAYNSDMGAVIEISVPCC
jgi:PAS domain S-box-containing protein